MQHESNYVKRRCHHCIVSLDKQVLGITNVTFEKMKQLENIKKNWDEMSTNLFQHETTLRKVVQDLRNKWNWKYKYIDDNND